MLKNCELCSAPAWVAFHCGPGNGKAGKREVWWWPISLVSQCPAAGGDKGRFWRKVTVGERKGVMAAVREPGEDKEVRCPAEFRVACLRGAWGGATRRRMLLASWGAKVWESWISLSSRVKSHCVGQREISTSTVNRRS